MTPWRERALEEARLLNPAFLSVLAMRIVQGYSSTVPTGMPLPLLFISMPLILHRDSRNSLPRSVVTSLAIWLYGRGDLRLRIVERAPALSPFVRESLVFGLQEGVLKLSDNGRLLPGSAAPHERDLRAFGSEETNSCIDRARFVGRWLARSGEPATIMGMWGVRP